MSASINKTILEYSQSILKASDELERKFSLDQIEKEPIFDSQVTKDVLSDSGLTSKENDAFGIDVGSFLNAAFAYSLYEAMKSHLKCKKDSLQAAKAENDKYLHQLLCILDASIATSRHYNADSCPMNVFSTIMLVCCSSSFSVRRFGEVFFSRESSSRRLALTHNNSLVGKAKPGSTLLQLGNNLIPKLYDQFEENNIFTAKLHLFIQSALGIGDKLSLASDWVVNRHRGLYQGLVESRNWPSSPPSTMSLPYQRIFTDYGKLMNWFTSQSVEDNLKMIINVLQKESRGSFREKDLEAENLYNFRRSIKWLKQDIDKILHPERNFHQGMPLSSEYLEYEGKSRQCEWVLNQGEFGLQLRNDCKNMITLMGQLVILVDYISRFCAPHVRVVMDKLARRKLKFKKPAAYDSVIENTHFYKEMQQFKAQILGMMEKSESTVFKHILEHTESNWELMKLQQFSHPDLENLKQHSASKKRKLDEYMQSCEDSSFKKKKPYFHKVGTARLSRVWRTETGLDNLKRGLKNKDETLEGYKDDIYMAEGALEEKKGQLKQLEKEMEKMKKEREDMERKRIEKEKKAENEKKDMKETEKEDVKEDGSQKKEDGSQKKEDESEKKEDGTDKKENDTDKKENESETKESDTDKKENESETKENDTDEKLENRSDQKLSKDIEKDKAADEAEQLQYSIDQEKYQKQIDDIAQLKKEVQKDARESSLLRWKMLRVSRSSGIWSEFRL